MKSLEAFSQSQTFSLSRVFVTFYFCTAWQMLICIWISNKLSLKEVLLSWSSHPLENTVTFHLRLLPITLSSLRVFGTSYYLHYSMESKTKYHLSRIYLKSRVVLFLFFFFLREQCGKSIARMYTQCVCAYIVTLFLAKEVLIFSRSNVKSCFSFWPFTLSWNCR